MKDEILSLQKSLAEKEIEMAAEEARRTAQEAEEREKQRCVCNFLRMANNHAVTKNNLQTETCRDHVRRFFSR
jgi:hypothetical protein